MRMVKTLRELYFVVLTLSFSQPRFLHCKIFIYTKNLELESMVQKLICIHSPVNTENIKITTKIVKMN